FPVQGHVPWHAGPLDWLRSLLLPSLTLALVHAALLTRLARAALCEQLRGDCIRSARAKGLRAPRLLLTHALQNAALPLVSTLGVSVGMLLGGVVVTESVFAVPGLGRLLIDAVASRDHPVVQALLLL